MALHFVAFARWRSALATLVVATQWTLPTAFAQESAQTTAPAPAAAPASEAAESAAPKPKVSPTADSLDLLVLGETRNAFLHIKLEIDGVSLGRLWSNEGLFQRLLTHFDRNGDAALDATEAARLPSPFSLRQLVWSPYSQFTGPAPAWAALDLDGDQKVVAAELGDFYRRAGLGGAVVGVGRAPATEQLTQALVKALDKNGDGKLSEDECRAAENVLSELDRNDDEIVGPGDLMTSVSYPGVSGAIQLLPPTLADLKPKTGDATRFAETADLPLLLFPTRLNDVAWRYAFHQRLGGEVPPEVLNGADPPAPTGPARRTTFSNRRDDELAPLTSEGLEEVRTARYREAVADVLWKVKFTTQPEASADTELIASASPVATARGELTDVIGSVRLTFRTDEGKLLEAAAERRKRVASRFDELDLDGNGQLDETETKAQNAGELRTLAAANDRDGDGTLSRAEVDEWLELHDQLTHAQVLVTVIDHGRGLFELLDVDHDGGLSLREIRSTWATLHAAGATT
ncbi:MAG TPA: EF-hand domain-containing protein, partial [Pirellulales bacterium]